MVLKKYLKQQQKLLKNQFKSHLKNLKQQLQQIRRLLIDFQELVKLELTHAKNN